MRDGIQGEPGAYHFVIDLPSRGGKRRQLRRRGFATKKEAREARDKLRAEMAGGLYVDHSRLTVGEYLTDHWLPTVAATVRPTTLDTYRRLVRLHLLPTLGPVRLQHLDRSQVARWLATLSTSGLSAKSVRNVHGTLNKALADAVELDLVARNVAARAKGLPSVERNAPRAWTVEQLQAFLAAVGTDRHGALWRFIAVTGCRRGEALGLRWSEVDLEVGTAAIVNQRTIAGGTVVEGPPKTRAGARTVALDPETVAVLRSWRRVQTEERLLMGAGWAGTDLVFTNPDGGGLWPQRVTATFRRVAGDLGLPLIGVHGLRHTAATWLISTGTNPRVVQQRLGHADVSVTLGLYTHVLPGHDRDAAAALGDALSARPVTGL